MQKITLTMLVAALAISGCATGSYVDPITNLRGSAISEANYYARNLDEFLNSGGSPEKALEKAKEAIASKLKDPGSAQFRNVKLKIYIDKPVVCGEVNAKNSYGGYVGFKRFIAGVDSGTLESSDNKYPQITYAANYGIDLACTGADFVPSSKDTGTTNKKGDIKT